MALISSEALPHFESMIYLPMILIILEQDRDSFKKGPFKLKGPYVKLIDDATKLVQAELKETRFYLSRHNMKVIRSKTDDTFTEYVFIHGGYEDERRYLNVRLRNRTEELLGMYFSLVKK
ncbi:hypothetical protein [Sporosarcina limicola]|uniref:Uncharacterized protein n=1 Tax=Sporosarcina limicola TaxID=34101 RepID=A0A927R4J6_9BACL|nr:hypothetical protein [Sporosarcina limicola]MBE1554973.1 hypothetical protein [Sporosarcina limicola]